MPAAFFSRCQRSARLPPASPPRAPPARWLPHRANDVALCCCLKANSFLASTNHSTRQAATREHAALMEQLHKTVPACVGASSCAMSRTRLTTLTRTRVRQRETRLRPRIKWSTAAAANASRSLHDCEQGPSVVTGPFLPIPLRSQAISSIFGLLSSRAFGRLRYQIYSGSEEADDFINPYNARLTL